MNANQDLVTAEGEASSSKSNVYPTPEFVMDELQYNRKPMPSGMSPRQEVLVRRKIESEERFRTLVSAMQMADTSQSSMQDTSSRRGSESIDQERKR